MTQTILHHTYQHIYLTMAAVITAISLGIPTGVLLTRYKRLATPVLGLIGAIQTIPSIALLGFFIPFLGIGAVPAIATLFLYGLLPIVRNTVTGIEEVDPSVKEAARAMGMRNFQILFKIELPLAAPVIFAGIRIAAMIGLGVATVCALIGAGGLGELILLGLYSNINLKLILAGAIPTAILALIIDFLLTRLQKYGHKIFRPLSLLPLIIFLAIIIWFIAPEIQWKPSTNSAQIDWRRFLMNRRSEIWRQSIAHINISLLALAFAIPSGLLAGMLFCRFPKISRPAMGILGILQTIPSIALLVLLLPFLGIGIAPALTALFLYALLPIVQNTHTGISEIDPAVKEAAQGMGMNWRQILLRVELPLAVPVIFAGVRTAAIIAVGNATLCSLVGAEGLGLFIFQGIHLKNSADILLGAFLAASVALVLDFILSIIEKHIQRLIVPVLIVFTFLCCTYVPFLLYQNFYQRPFRAGFPVEFLRRTDGYPGLQKEYGLTMDSMPLDSSLMYVALKEAEVDVIAGYTTDGRIKSYGFKILQDDHNFFPPYHAAPLVRMATLKKFPQLIEVFAKLDGKMPDAVMTELNYRVDQNQQSPQDVAKDFLKQLGLETRPRKKGPPDIVIGCKKFSEQYILMYIFTYLIENYTDLTVDLKPGLAGTKICFDALTAGEIDLYPEYTGTALLVLIKADKTTVDKIIKDSQKVYRHVHRELQSQHQLELLPPLGFSNSYALMMRSRQAKDLKIESISDLARFLQKENRQK